MFSTTKNLSLIDAALPVASPGVRIARDVLLIVGFSLFVAGMARISVFLPFTPVPLTGQTLAVLLTGGALGSWRGGASLTLYLFLGSLFPFYAGDSGDYVWDATAGGYIFGITSGNSGLFWELASGGYLIGFIAAAYLIGFLSERGWDRKSWIILAMLAGNALLYVPGLIQLSLFVPNDKVLEYGLYPFIAGDLIKLYIAAITVPAAWALLNLKRRSDAPWT